MADESMLICTFYQGYLSFWNDNISYALRGCIVIELAFRGRISMQKDSARRRFPLSDRIIEVVDESLTGEVLLDEALKMMKSSEKMSVSQWIDLMSGTAILPLPLCPNAHYLPRRNMESHEDWLPIEASSGKTCQRTG